MNNIVLSLNKTDLNAKLQGDTEKKIICSNSHATIKIEPNYVIRGCLEIPVIMPANTNVEEQFFPVDMLVASKAEVYGGKICAALDRQHPRDLFDIKYLLEQDGEISQQILWGFVAFLLSSNRPLHEIILPNTVDNRSVLEAEFKGMSDIEFTYEQHLQVLHQLVDIVQGEMKKTYKAFLLDFITLCADLSQYKLDKLPAIQWKLQESNPSKFEEQYAKLCGLLE